MRNDNNNNNMHIIKIFKVDVNLLSFLAYDGKRDNSTVQFCSYLHSYYFYHFKKYNSARRSRHYPETALVKVVNDLIPPSVMAPSGLPVLVFIEPMQSLTMTLMTLVMKRNISH